MNINELYAFHCKRKSDINSHLPILKVLADSCEHVTEFGIRKANGSTIAFLASSAKVKSIDIEITDEAMEVFYQCEHEDREWDLEGGDTLSITLDKTDLLFIDTLHTYNQLKKELERHESVVKKYIVLHDTETFGRKGEDNKNRGLMDAIEEFLHGNTNWKMKKHYKNNNGLTILERIK